MRRSSLSGNFADALIYLFMIFVIGITLYPFIYVLSMSISNPVYVINNSVWLYPKGFSLEAYAKVFDNPDVWISYSNTVFYTAVGTAVNILLTIFAAYPLSRRGFVLRTPIMFLILFTMFFGGGLIPLFMLVNQIGLYDTRWIIILLSAVSAYYIIIARTFLQGLPESLQESARIDGANDIVILFKVVIPLSKPILAVLALFYAVGHWNSYFNALLFLSSPNLQPISLYLVKVLVQNSGALMAGMEQDINRALFSVQLKYALIIVTILPILILYPFLQKHFVKGVMIGSVKE